MKSPTIPQTASSHPLIQRVASPRHDAVLQQQHNTLTDLIL